VFGELNDRLVVCVHFQGHPLSPSLKVTIFFTLRFIQLNLTNMWSTTFLNNWIRIEHELSITMKKLKKLLLQFYSKRINTFFHPIHNFLIHHILRLWTYFLCLLHCYVKKKPGNLSVTLKGKQGETIKLPRTKLWRRQNRARVCECSSS